MIPSLLSHGPLGGAGCWLGPHVLLELSLGCEEHGWLWRHWSWCWFHVPSRVPSVPKELLGQREDSIQVPSGRSPGCPHAMVFPVPSTTALWDPPVGSQRGILLSNGCLEHVQLFLPGAPQARVRLYCRSGSSLGVGCTAGSPWDIGRQRERHKRGVRGSHGWCARRCPGLSLYVSPVIPAYNAIVFLFVLANFSMATFMDPGIFPRGESCSSWEELPPCTLPPR